MSEVWKAIPGFEGKYEISNFGDVKSLRRKANGRYGLRTIPERILKPAARKSGHLCVVLGREGGTKDVHKLVMLAFVGEPPDGHEVLHLNHTPSDNRISNLKYGTRGENLKMDYAAGVRKTPINFICSRNGKRK